MNASQKIAQLQRLLEHSANVKVRDSDDAEFRSWHAMVERTLNRVFGDGSPEFRQFRELKFYYSASMMILGSDYSADHRRIFDRDFSVLISLLRSCVDELRLEETFTESTPSTDRTDSRNVFVIHGRDTDFAEVVARFLEKRGLTATILHEQPNQGRTIIEKFQDHAHPCGFAVALLTADDEGRLRGGGDDLKPRARQNVILELGYFLGAIGRERVAVLHRGEVELPSDYAGIVYIPVDDEWRTKLGQELDAAGLPANSAR